MPDASPPLPPGCTDAHAPSTLVAWVAAVKRTVEDLGVDAVALMQAAGMDLSRLSDPHARYPVDQSLAFWQSALQATRDPLLGLEVARRIGPMTLHALGYALLSSTHLEDMLVRLARYFQVVSDAGTLSFERHGATGCLRMVGDDRVMVQAQAEAAWAAIDSFMLTALRGCRALYGPDFRVLELRLQRPRPADMARFEQAFRLQPVFGCEDNALWLDEEVLHRPLAHGNAELARMNEEVTRQYLARWKSAAADDVAMALRRVLREMLPNGDPDQDEVAARLGLGTRALQRRLTEQGTRYRDVLDELRLELARQYLQEPGCSIGDIAWLLGFAEVSAFTRAFRRWTGQSPSAWRDQCERRGPGAGPRVSM